MPYRCLDAIWSSYYKIPNKNNNCKQVIIFNNIEKLLVHMCKK